MVRARLAASALQQTARGTLRSAAQRHKPARNCPGASACPASKPHSGGPRAPASQPVIGPFGRWISHPASWPLGLRPPPHRARAWQARLLCPGYGPLQSRRKHPSPALFRPSRLPRPRLARIPVAEATRTHGLMRPKKTRSSRAPWSVARKGEPNARLPRAFHRLHRCVFVWHTPLQKVEVATDGAFRTARPGMVGLCRRAMSQ